MTAIARFIKKLFKIVAIGLVAICTLVGALVLLATLLIANEAKKCETPDGTIAETCMIQDHVDLTDNV